MNDTLTIFTDGGSRGNPGPSAAAFWVPSLQIGGSKFLGKVTNNVAEYQGVILALEFAIGRGVQHLQIKSDSKLIVNQVNQLWQVKDDNLRSLRDRVWSSSSQLQSFSIDYVPRAQNVEADRECNECLDDNEAGYQNLFA